MSTKPANRNANALAALAALDSLATLKTAGDMTPAAPQKPKIDPATTPCRNESSGSYCSEKRCPFKHSHIDSVALQCEVFRLTAQCLDASCTRQHSLCPSAAANPLKICQFDNCQYAHGRYRVCYHSRRASCRNTAKLETHEDFPGWLWCINENGEVGGRHVQCTVEAAYGLCSGVDCKFSHTNTQSAFPTAARLIAINEMIKPTAAAPARQPQCYYASINKCARGKECKFTHIPCRHETSSPNGICENDKCDYAHTNKASARVINGPTPKAKVD